MLKITLFLVSLLLNNITNTTPRSSSDPYISGDSFRAIADHIFDETNQRLNPNNVRHKDIIFVGEDVLRDSTILNNFFTNIHPHIKNKYFLITHNSDNGVPSKFKSYLDEEKIIIWFGINPTIRDHKKFIPIPIGLANNYWKHGKTRTFDRVLNKANKEKKYLLGINFNTFTNASLRTPVYNFFANKNFCSRIDSRNHQIYLELMQKSKFIISPEGNGLDCHRTWEALLMGAIPIIKTSMLDPIFSDLPVLIVKDWHEITEEFLHKKYIEFQNNRAHYNYKKLYFAYWRNLIGDYRKNVK